MSQDPSAAGPGTPGGPTRADASAPGLGAVLRAPAGAVRLASGVLTASGCAAAGQELEGYLDLTSLGAVVTKSIMRRPRSGRPTPRMAETPSGMLNAIGLQGDGVEALVSRDLPWLADRGVRAVVSVAGEDVGEFAEVANAVSQGAAGLGPLPPGTGGGVLAAVEANISCPNVANRGQVFACHPGTAAEVVAAVREATDPRVPVLAKLSPDVTDIVEIAAACLAAGADGLTAINTLLGVAIDVDRLAPVLARTTGGLSGPAIRPVAVRCVWQLHAAMRAGVLPAAPIVGVGGIRSARDAAELVLAGACAVQVGTATFGDPGAAGRVLDGLAELLARHDLPDLAAMAGLAHDRTRSGPATGPGSATGAAAQPLAVRP